jgi:hypothetical protein
MARRIYPNRRLRRSLAKSCLRAASIYRGHRPRYAVDGHGDVCRRYLLLLQKQNRSLLPPFASRRGSLAKPLRGLAEPLRLFRKLLLRARNQFLGCYGYTGGEFAISASVAHCGAGYRDVHTRCVAPRFHSLSTPPSTLLVLKPFPRNGADYSSAQFLFQKTYLEPVKGKGYESKHSL